MRLFAILRSFSVMLICMAIFAFPKLNAANAEITKEQYAELRLWLLREYGLPSGEWGQVDAVWNGIYPGAKHPGTDFGTKNQKVPVYSVSEGIVTAVGGANNMVCIYNDQTRKTFSYLHFSGVNVRTGDTIHQGDLIGMTGNTMAFKTGSTAIHLHFDVRNGKKEYASPSYDDSCNPYEASAEVHKSGTIAINPQFNCAEQFKDGLAAVRIDSDGIGRWGYINKNGDTVIKAKYNRCGSFSEGLAYVEVDEKYGFIDKNGLMVIKPQYDYAYSFSEGLSAVYIDEKYGYINRNGKTVINFQYATARSFKEGLSLVGISREGKIKYGYIDAYGKVIINPQFDYAEDFQEGLAPVKVGTGDSGKWGYIDKSGELKIKAQFDYAFQFYEGLAAVRINGYLGFIDKRGNFTITPKFSDIGHFSEGLANVHEGDYRTGKSGYIDKNGNYAISCRFYRAEPFSEGFAAVSLGIQDANKWNYIDKKNTFLTNEKYDNPMITVVNNTRQNFSEGFAVIKKENKYGYITK
jgi:hypothetical protein